LASIAFIYSIYQKFYRSNSAPEQVIVYTDIAFDTFSAVQKIHIRYRRLYVRNSKGVTHKFENQLIGVFNLFHFASQTKTVFEGQVQLKKTSALFAETIQLKESDMLILTRRANESIKIGDEITVSVLAIQGNQVRIGIDAPKSIPVHRDEIYQRIQIEKQQEQESLLKTGA